MSSSSPAVRPGRRLRFSIRGLMVLVLVVASNCGILVWSVGHRRREGRMWGEVGAQREVTFMALHGPDPAISRFSSSQPLQFGGGGNGRDGRRWFDGDASWVVEDGRRRDRTRIAVTGGGHDGWDDFDLDPIVIEDRGGELNAHSIAKLVAAYKSRGWAYRVVKPAAPPAP